MYGAVSNIIRKLFHKMVHEDVSSVKRFLNEYLFRLSSDRTHTRCLNLFKSLPDLSEYYRGVISKSRENIEVRSQPENVNPYIAGKVKTQWFNYCDEIQLKTFPSKYQFQTFRTSLYRRNDVENHKKLSMENIEPFSWNCQDVQKFWEEYTVNISSNMKYTSFSDGRLLDLLNLAKIYLTVCHEMNTKPFFPEYLMQVDSTTNIMTKIGGGPKGRESFWMYWMLGCPLPPPEGLY